MYKIYHRIISLKRFPALIVVNRKKISGIKMPARIIPNRHDFLYAYLTFIFPFMIGCIEHR